MIDLNTIDKLTSENGLYTCNVSFKYLNDTIKEYIDDYGLILNPDFQRGHVWNENQQQKFIEYILRGGRMDYIKFNHTSWSNFDKNGEMVVVDGLQRLTAIMKFLNNELKVFDNYSKDFTNFYPLRYTLPIMINNLKTRKEYLKWYLEINNGGTPHTTDEIKKVEVMLEKELLLNKC